MKLYIIIFNIIFFVSCTQKNRNEIDENNSFENIKIENKYAKGFFVTYNNMYKTIHIKNPWQGAKDVELKYILVDSGQIVSEELLNENIIRTPVKRIVCLSTTHAAMIEFLDEEKSIVGIAGSDYIYSDKMRSRIVAGLIKDVGYDSNLNYELLISLKPDLVIIYGVGSEANQISAKLKDLKIPSIINAEYLEESVLAKTEWIKFIGLLFNKEKIAADKFSEIESEYLNLKELVKTITEKPKVLTGLPWKGTWWIPGGKSHMAQLISDAGAEFLWKDNLSKESFPQSIEMVFEKANQANVWINSGAAKNKTEILSVDERLQNLKIFHSGYIYNNTARINKYGGNDFWESGVVNPQIILKDLICIFHPELFPDYLLRYYKKI